VSLLSHSGKVLSKHMGRNSSTTSFCHSRNVTFAAATEFFMGVVSFTVRNTASHAQTTHDVAQSPCYYLGSTEANGSSPLPVTTKFDVGTYTLSIASEYTPTLVTTVPFSRQELLSSRDAASSKR
jgi:hypothetical protein